MAASWLLAPLLLARALATPDVTFHVLERCVSTSRWQRPHIRFWPSSCRDQKGPSTLYHKPHCVAACFARVEARVVSNLSGGMENFPRDRVRRGRLGPPPEFVLSGKRTKPRALKRPGSYERNRALQRCDGHRHACMGPALGDPLLLATLILLLSSTLHTLICLCAVLCLGTHALMHSFVRSFIEKLSHY